MLISGLLAMWLAQVIKVPIWYAVTRKWKWHLMVEQGGMPSSHAALVCATTISIGMHEGFDQATFALALALSLVVLYDAAGVRRQAGYHAQKINVLLDELMSGHPISQETLKEVIGHTPRQVLVGGIFGVIIGFLVTYFWNLH
jgi:acid phosphatase family membrane protein YuiD